MAMTPNIPGKQPPEEVLRTFTPPPRVHRLNPRAVIVVLGGLGSIIGPFWGGMTIGLVQQLSTLVLPTQLQNTAIFIVFLLIVFFMPQGFFGRVTERT